MLLKTTNSFLRFNLSLDNNNVYINCNLVTYDIDLSNFDT